MDKIELNLDNPIFALYVNVENCSRQRSEELVDRAKKSMDIYTNITIWIIPSNVTKIECLYDGRSKNREMELNDLLKEINIRIDILSKSKSFDDFKLNIRDWRINKLVDGDN